MSQYNKSLGKSTFFLPNREEREKRYKTKNSSFGFDDDLQKNKIVRDIP